MSEILKTIFGGKWGLKKFIGLFVLILGLILHMIPLFPASGIVVIGLELLGIRILLQDKIKLWLEKRQQKQK
jgi:uncharacterized membrane protein